MRDRSSPDVYSLFQRAVVRYDLLNHLFSLGVDLAWRRRLVDAAAAPSGSRVLDVCTGTADVAIAFALHDPTLHIDGVDFSENMIERAREKTAQRGFSGRISLELADALDLPYADSSFEVVCSAFGLRNLKDRRQGIHEMARVVRNEGRVLILEFSPPSGGLIGSVFGWYLRTVIPPIGGLVSGVRDSYDHLSSSILSFWSPAEVCAAMAAEHLEGVSVQRLFGGIANLYVGTKRRA